MAAPVGFQCPECVRQAQGSVPAPRSVLGGRAIQRPTVTFVLIAINALAFGASWLLGEETVTGMLGMYPPALALDSQWWRLLTSPFLHYGILHLAFNMYVLFALGPALERALGHWRYLTLYVVAAVSGAVVSFAFSPVNVNSVGASGAIFGLMGALLVAGRRLRYDIRQVVILVVINIAIGFLPGSAVDWRAHLGGLVGGAVVAFLFTRVSGPKRGMLQVAGVTAYLVLLVIVCAWRAGDIAQGFGAPSWS